MQSLPYHPAAGLDCLVQRRAKVEPQPAPRHGDNVATWGAGRVFEVFSGTCREMHDVAVTRYDDMRRRELLDHPALRKMPQRHASVVP